jgi:hypothetical protein
MPCCFLSAFCQGFDATKGADVAFFLFGVHTKSGRGDITCEADYSQSVQKGFASLKKGKKNQFFQFLSSCRPASARFFCVFAVFDKFLAKTAVLFLHKCAFELNATPEPRWVRAN